MCYGIIAHPGVEAQVIVFIIAVLNSFIIHTSEMQGRFQVNEYMSGLGSA